ncbi:ABC transporter substrate-binding protein [Arthrobacter sp. ISL-65]|uniref:ABC transporter substrate-binding protein n=1 Tax=Arthrobacter sp. ISL-65 TaxID=2819112 RepID=UPI001BE6E35C|nr:extracellular solute-binding protein [Arthrobacter sp. ISL-65]MBT2548998.1 extracellular solute-binding protein [Arthrobacter sp. ISL-65]
MSDSLFSRSVDRRAVLRTGMLGALGLAATPALAACGGGSASGGSGAGGSVSWAAWANPGEGERYKQFATELGKKINAKVNFQAVVGDYQAKMLSQLAGGAAPDAFYVGDADMAKMIDAKQISDLTEYLNGGKAPIKLEDFPEDLYQWCKPADGSAGIFGIPVDCNPSVLWFNKDVLSAAGVSQDPSQLFEAGRWTPDALEDLLGKVRASGKKGLILANWWFNWCWATTMFGGQLTDGSGKLVFADDPKAQQGLEWLLAQFKSGNITYAGSLPKGQSGDALFLAGQLALNNVGRWALPTLKDVKFGYDIAPVPSPSGKDIVPVPVATAAIALNAKAKNREKALELIGNYVSRDGQKFRLSGGGNAVPSIKGLDEIATEGGVPVHGQWFNDVVAKGYAIPRAFVGNSKTATELPLLVDKLFKDSSTTAASFSSAVTRLVESTK